MTYNPRVLNETIKKLMDIEGLLLVRAASELLDAITPIIVAAEREAAIDAIKAKCVMHQDGSPYYIDADGDEINEIFEAIRARKP